MAKSPRCISIQLKIQEMPRTYDLKCRGVDFDVVARCPVEK